MWLKIFVKVVVKSKMRFSDHIGRLCGHKEAKSLLRATGIIFLCASGGVRHFINETVPNGFRWGNSEKNLRYIDGGHFSCLLLVAQAVAIGRTGSFERFARKRCDTWRPENVNERTTRRHCTMKMKRIIIIIISRSSSSSSRSSSSSKGGYLRTYLSLEVVRVVFFLSRRAALENRTGGLDGNQPGSSGSNGSDRTLFKT